LIQQLRDEAHRFGLSHHRKKRSKEQIKSELDSIKGIGSITKKKLLATFKSIKRLKEADHAEIEKTVGKSKAKIIIDWIEGVV
jgi:excinuclease ABC subunit C